MQTSAQGRPLPSLPHRVPHPPLARGRADCAPEPVARGPEHGGARDESRDARVGGVVVHDLLKRRPLQAGKGLDFSHGEAGNEVEQGADPFGHHAGEYVRQGRRSSSTNFFDDGNGGKFPPVASRYTNPIAERIASYARDTEISLRELSRRAKLSESTAQKVCDRLETSAGDVGLATLTALAHAMDKSLTWLLYGDAPPKLLLLRDLTGWDAAAREAVERLGADAATVRAVGGWAVHEPPSRLDAWYVAGIARAHRGH
jgi:hypothetical protein